MRQDIDNKEELIKEFKTLYPSCDEVSVYVDHCVKSTLNVVVYMFHNFETVSFDKLIKIATIFGTTKFAISLDKHTENYAISDVTMDSETTYEIMFSVDLKDVNTGLPWKHGFFDLTSD